MRRAARSTGGARRRFRWVRGYVTRRVGTAHPAFVVYKDPNEVGHVLGLNHVNDTNRLMTGGGTANITNPPPDLVESERQTMENSALTQNC